MVLFSTIRNGVDVGCMNTKKNDSAETTRLPDIAIQKKETQRVVICNIEL